MQKEFDVRDCEFVHDKALHYLVVKCRLQTSKSKS